MRVSMLGSFEIRDGSGRPVALGGRRVAMLLARLALSPGTLVPTGTLIDDLWEDDPPGDGSGALHRLVSRARQSLRRHGVEDLTVVSRSGGYELTADPDQVDTHRFEHLAALGRRQLRAGSPTEAGGTLAECLDLWRGAPLMDFAANDFASRAARRLEELHINAAEDNAEAELALGHAARTILELRTLCDAHPLRERPVGLLIRALCATDRQAEALLAYERLRTALDETLGVVPSASLRELHTDVLRGRVGPAGRDTGVPAERGTAPGAATATGPASPPQPQPRPQPGLPSRLTRFVGREAESERLTAAFGTSRLATLYGPGGAGKTRLATEFAARSQETSLGFHGFVELAPVGNGQDLAEYVTAALGLNGPRRPDHSPAGHSAFHQLADALSSRPGLLVLDNCEHLIAQTARFAGQLLARCRELRILATSREPLVITGEVLCRVGPLELPGSPEEAERSTAVQLFCDRARLVRPDFALHADNTAQVVEICRQLDGLPLAIELAAARLRSMSVEQVAGRLDDRFRLLADGSRSSSARHRTLRAMMDWSWDLLSGPERTLARRMSAVPGTMSAETAVAVCADPDVPEDEILYLLSALTDKSLVQVRESPRGAIRYGMPETARAYCRERLLEAGEADRTEAACARHFLDLVERAAAGLRGTDQPECIARLDAEHDNALSALRRAVERDDVEASVRFGLALCWYWVMRGRYTEAAGWLAELLRFGDRIPEQAAALFSAVRLVLPAPVGEDRQAALREAAERARACHAMEVYPLLALIEPKCRQMTGGYEGLVEAAERAVRHDDPWARATGVAALGFAAEAAGDAAVAEEHLGAALDLFRELGDRWSTGQLTMMLSKFRSLRGDNDAALACLREARDAVQQVGSAEDLVQILLRLGTEQIRAGDLDAAGAAFREALHMVRYPMPEYEVLVTTGLGELAVARGRPDAAREHFAQAVAKLGDAVFDQEFLRIEILRGLGALALAEGDVEQARAAVRDVLRTAAPFNDLSVPAPAAELCAATELREGDAEASARLLGAATSLRGRRDDGSPLVRELLRELTGLLGQEEFERHYGTGTSLTQKDALALLHGMLGEDMSGRSHGDVGDGDVRAE
ncbi:AfsR/SARP family transcriptional regulator [Streptomyces meridianus]|uniref:AAA family ATPase n=1 Tax=Streptomyces meridianus TaxID=2938945 RepID=A0ABT0X8E8_9ACTN|nr:BTAD domain-containing putative transcriptional regulator [Streptomyces meridianus]MCM2577997.1 AAA family ATPase [Streptomyces meridianus]